MFRNAVLLLLLISAGWVLWTTRDTHADARLIPADQAYQVFVSDPLEKRLTIAASDVWGLLPEDSALRNLPARLSADLGLPQWVLDNLVTGACHISGNDLEGFSDALIVTRMSRAGCLIERMYRYLPAIEKDWAGGLCLRSLPDEGLFYAVRGRVLALSPSREALIRALTLTEDDATDEDALRENLKDLGEEEDVYALLRLSADDPLGTVFERVRVGLRLDAHAAEVSCRGLPRDTWRERFAGLLETAVPRQLLTPPEGLLAVSANFGRPVQEVWLEMFRALEQPDPLGGLLEKLSAIDAGEGTAAAAAVMGELLARTGHGWRVTWTGIDANEIVPVPEIVGVFDADARAMGEALAAAAPPREDAALWGFTPHYDPVKRCLHMPLLSGPSLEPAAALFRGGLLLSSSRTLAERLLAQDAEPAPLPREGNLYIRLKPYAALRALVDAGKQFAEFGALRGFTEKTFADAAEPWLATAAHIEEVAMALAHDDGMLSIHFNLVMAGNAQ